VRAKDGQLSKSITVPIFPITVERQYRNSRISFCVHQGRIILKSVAMGIGYQELLEAVIKYLEELKFEGQKYAPVSASTLALLDSVPAPVARGHSKKTIPRQGKQISRPPAESADIEKPTIQIAAPTTRPVIAEPVKREIDPDQPQPHPLAPPKVTMNPEHVFKPLIPEDMLQKDTSPIAPVLEAIKGLSLPDAMAELRKRTVVCQRCPHLVKARKNVVFGVGSIQSPLMFVGEAPGADEDEQGEPFVGRAGQLLTKIIQTMGFTRETVYIANILKCRPDTPGQTAGNRKPTLDEMNTCLPYLLAQVNLIKPKVIVALGVTAMEGLLGKVVQITRVRGQFFDFRGTPVMATYHPAYLLRNQSLAVKREVWEDMLKVLEKLEYPISEKQRKYFLKAE